MRWTRRAALAGLAALCFALWCAAPDAGAAANTEPMVTSETGGQGSSPPTRVTVGNARRAQIDEANANRTLRR